MMFREYTFGACTDSRRRDRPSEYLEPRRKNPVVAIKIVVERFFGTLWNSSSLEFSGVTRELTRISTILPPALCIRPRRSGRELHSADFFTNIGMPYFSAGLRSTGITPEKPQKRCSDENSKMFVFASRCERRRLRKRI